MRYTAMIKGAFTWVLGGRGPMGQVPPEGGIDEGRWEDR